MTETIATILAVDDEPVVEHVLRGILAELSGSRFEFVPDVAAARAKLGELASLELAILDKNVGDDNGLDMIPEIRERFPYAEIIILTGYASMTSAQDAVRLGVYEYMTKPMPDIDRALMTFRNAIESSRLRNERETLLADLRSSDVRYQRVLRGTSDGIWDWDLESNTIYYSPRWSEMLGVDTVTSDPEEWLGRVHSDDRDRLQAAIDRHCVGEIDRLEIEYRMTHTNGEERWFSTRAVADRDPTGRAVRLAGANADVTDRKVAEYRLRHDAYHDRLTGLPNRSGVELRVAEGLASGEQFLVMALDVPRFALINDELGFTAGDQVLMEIASCMRDVMPEGTALGRIDGSRFIAVLRGVELDAAAGIADAAHRALVEPILVGAGREVFVNLRIGVAAAQSDATPEQMMIDAEAACRAAESGGMLLFSEADASRRSELELDAALRHAMERNELESFFQPIVRGSIGSIAAFEALARWRRPGHGIVPPGVFLPWAERSGLIRQINTDLRRRAIEIVAGWNRRLPAEKRVALSLNLTAVELDSAELVSELEQLIAANEMDPSLIKLEVLETALLHNDAVAIARMEELKAIGVGISLDDFGTGYSSLSYLHRMPIDTVKIDREFVWALEDNPRATQLVRAIVGLAASLELAVVAEGVETEEQRDLLAGLGCTLMQGYLFSRPVPADEAEALLTADSSAEESRG